MKVLEPLVWWILFLRLLGLVGGKPRIISHGSRPPPTPAVSRLYLCQLSVLICKMGRGLQLAPDAAQGALHVKCNL